MNKLENKDFLTLEEMRDHLDQSTSEYIPKSSRKKSKTSNLENKSDKKENSNTDEHKEKENKDSITVKEKSELSDEIKENTQSVKDNGEKTSESLESSENLKTEDSKDSINEKSQDDLSLEKQKKKNDSIAKFMTESGNNIYSDSKNGVGSSIFETGQFSQNRIDPEDVKAFKKMKISETDVRQFQKFRKQRLKKAESFDLERASTLHSERMRPLYAEQENKETDQEDIALIDDNLFEEMEYNEKADGAEVLEYISLSKRRMGFLTLGLLIVTVLSVVLQILITAKAPLPAFITPAQPISFSIINIFILILSGVLAKDVILCGLKSFVERRPNRDSLCGLMMAGCLVQTIILLFSGDTLTINEDVFLLTPVACGALLMHHFGKWLANKRALLNFRYISADEYDHYACGVISNEDLATAFTRGHLKRKPVVGFNRKADFLNDFMYYSFSSDITDKISVYLAPIALCAAFLFGGVAAVSTGNFWICATAFATILCLFSTFSYLISINLPLLFIQKKLIKYSASLLGYEAGQEFGDLNAVITSAHKLFPEGSVELHGMRAFNKHPIDDSILCAASILSETKSILKDMFMDIMLGNDNYLKEVDSILFEDALGVSGWVENRRVIVGNEQMMTTHNIEMPPKHELEKLERPDCETIYIAISGEICAAFVYTLYASKSVLSALRMMELSNLILVVQTVDPVITPQKMLDVFDVDTDMVKILPARFHKPYRKQVKPVENESSGAINNGRFDSFVRSIVASKKLKNTTRLNMIISISSIVISILVFLLCLTYGSISLFSAIPILIVEFMFVLAISIISWIRS